jgi:LmbE family N-acetylglucosaminyl deacetylase/glycosyltransferase involved in cell wall biosynthesis
MVEIRKLTESNNKIMSIKPAINDLPLPESLVLPPRPSVAAILPAYNEATWIGKILDVLREVDSLDEIIVIDDGSTDSTGQIVTQGFDRDARLRLISHPENRGKGQAILSGWRTSSAGFILLLDADLIGLTPGHLRALIDPVISGKVDMTVGVFTGGYWLTDLSHTLAPWMSGQRCLRSALLNRLHTEAAAGYGFETALTILSSKEDFRIHMVPMPGISHPPSEFHRGIWRGLLNRQRMYRDVWTAYRLTRNTQPIQARRSVSTRWLPLLFFLLLGSGLIFNRSRASSYYLLEDIPSLPLEEVGRILIISPHPDDETLGAGGLIQVAQELGIEIHIVVMTNGDGQYLAPLALSGRVRPRIEDFIALGERRQVETIAALMELGLSEENVSFLGYPDRSLHRLWIGNWQVDCPYPSAYTRYNYSPYVTTFNPDAMYCGRDVLEDIRSILSAYQPDVIVVPHPNDDHPDHRAGANFTRLAVMLNMSEEQDYHPQMWSYLTHYGSFPQPRGLRRSAKLLPPISLASEPNQWMNLELTSGQVDTKYKAIRKYPSQIRLLGNFLPSFARRNELFSSLDLIDLSPLAFNTIPLLETGVKELPVIPEPAGESARKALIGGGDLVGWRVARLGDKVFLTADTRGVLIPGFQYRILIKLPDGTNRTYFTHSPEMTLTRSSFMVQLDMQELGDPPVLGFSADILQGVTMDRTGWYFVLLRNWWE